MSRDRRSTVVNNKYSSEECPANVSTPWIWIYHVCTPSACIVGLHPVGIMYM